MVVVQLNATCSQGSTGKICVSISRLLTEAGIDNYILYSSGTSDYNLGYRYCTDLQIKSGVVSSRIFGNWGFENKRATRKLINRLERLKPDVIHLHNIHGHACHLALLFDWIKKQRIKVVWTFHDCWAYTGYCMYYEAAACDSWKTVCRNCPQKGTYSLFADKSEKLFNIKKDLLKGLDLTIISPSQWLADQIRQSFLSEYPVKVINNGIDLSVFRPVESGFKTKHKISGRHMVLGVSMIWEARKGIDAFIKLSESLGDDYKIVLVGTDEKTDAILPEKIISIHKTQNQSELAALYSSADVFVNPTLEDNFPTVNLEALACGTPVITYRTGGSPEIIDEKCGCVVEKGDIVSLKREIERVCETKPYTMQDCIQRAQEFDKNIKFTEYISFYKSIR